LPFLLMGLHIAFPLNSGYTDTGNHLVIARASDGGVEQVLAAPFRIRALRYLADGRLLAACMQRENYYWDLAVDLGGVQQTRSAELITAIPGMRHAGNLHLMATICR
jgi:hypothetical protein